MHNMITLTDRQSGYVSSLRNSVINSRRSYRTSLNNTAAFILATCVRLANRMRYVAGREGAKHE